ncbi:hypothetical protein BV22DRAFT_924689 [Leucogyrophana mollusca]|uniref:Uncharacterized protein n=1 Tax=Leucogyrophana mollusca TaxID=85980 RepID=A0ACB8AXZ2_9AGAM|nr:hypothetical protein BV22DRAFT_924689 [Leucogyrophana mollusca]
MHAESSLSISKQSTPQHLLPPQGPLSGAKFLVLQPRGASSKKSPPGRAPLCTSLSLHGACTRPPPPARGLSPDAGAESLEFPFMHASRALLSFSYVTRAAVFPPSTRRQPSPSTIRLFHPPQPPLTEVLSTPSPYISLPW